MAENRKVRLSRIMNKMKPNKKYGFYVLMIRGAVVVYLKE